MNTEKPIDTESHGEEKPLKSTRKMEGAQRKPARVGGLSGGTHSEASFQDVPLSESEEGDEPGGKGGDHSETAHIYHGPVNKTA